MTEKHINLMVIGKYQEKNIGVIKYKDIADLYIIPNSGIPIACIIDHKVYTFL